MKPGSGVRPWFAPGLAPSFFFCLRWVPRRGVSHLIQKETFLFLPLKVKSPGSGVLSMEPKMRCVCVCVCAWVWTHACVLGRGQEGRCKWDSGWYLPVGPDKENLEEVVGSVSSWLQEAKSTSLSLHFHFHLKLSEPVVPNSWSTYPWGSWRYLKNVWLHGSSTGKKKPKQLFWPGYMFEFIKCMEVPLEINKIKFIIKHF